ncbi:CoA-binding protein [Persicitalea jodogahamensis]|uniref:CoA-binding protein n=1 Tax=Persicitalea jodogahamensis TaxID=402147 RepID=A0A8J3D5N3_9BACT|nr:CoA-binding protein [Persicitalea jodogahamensis]GHB56740.1 CoA-binding protein [Persicitalea jodogahamensis]
MKKTLIIGATSNPSRYAFSAAHRLKRHGHEIVQIGLRPGEVAGEPIHTQKGIHDAIDTVTLYVGPRNQPEYYDYVVSLHPKRVIFNPGTENSEFENLLTQNGIEPIEACTLVMLSTGQY